MTDQMTRPLNIHPDDVEYFKQFSHMGLGIYIDSEGYTRPVPLSVALWNPIVGIALTPTTMVMQGIINIPYPTRWQRIKSQVKRFILRRPDPYKHYIQG